MSARPCWSAGADERDDPVGQSRRGSRIAEVPDGGVADIKMPDGDPEPDDLWLKPPSMQHP
jgi:hypothetical protein